MTNAPAASREATARLLWAAGRPEPAVDEVRGALDAGPDAPSAITLAKYHGLGPLLWRALGAAERPDGLGVIGDELVAEANVLRAAGLLLLPHALATSVGVLSRDGFEPVVFKGPSLAERYPDPGLRSMVDIDVILPPSQHDDAVRVLVGRGWEVQRAADRHHYDTVLAHADVPGLFLELHRGLDVWYQRSTGLRAEDLWRRRVARSCLGTPAFGLEPEVELIALAAHAGKPFHCFSRLIWAVDLVVITQHARAGGRPVDWHEVRRLAAAWRCRTVLAVALGQAVRLGLDCPADLTELPGRSIRRAALAPPLQLEWPLARADEGTRHRLRYALADGWTQRAVLFAGAPAPAPVVTWPARYAGALSQGVARAWRMWRRADA
jgi:hypothetical protein